MIPDYLRNRRHPLSIDLISNLFLDMNDFKLNVIFSSDTSRLIRQKSPTTFPSKLYYRTFLFILIDDEKSS